MRRFAFTLLASAALTAAVAAPAMAQSKFDGPYVGAFAGYNDGDVETNTGEVGVDGFSFGGYAGFGQTFDRFYLGAEGEVGYTDVDGSDTVGALAAAYETDWTYGLAARAGFLVTPDILAYGKVGYQWTGYEGTATLGATTVAFDRTFDGWRYGGGVEVALADNLTTRVEYNYTDYDAYTPATIGGTLTRVQPTDHAIRVGVAYRF